MIISFLSNSEYPKISKLVNSVNLDEKIDFKCTFLYSADEKGNLRGVAGTNLTHNIPRFEHIIICTSDQKTSLGYRLMLATEQMLKDKGFKFYVSYILKDNFKMRNYATKFGFKEYEKKEKGDWFVKNLGENI